ncbi:endonuclease/exonuclease/phosphatase family protein [Micromonospora vinacea]|uniref:endonuclease/exonuclease/phosphatase family protein n=1 Tax=Micromonospora vinacea TaxID=709878 RepID=UPI003D8C47EE
MTTDDEPAGLRVLTLNLLTPEFADWESRRAVLKSGLADLRPDVVALQETVWGNGYDQAADLLGPDRHVVRHGGRSADGVGAALVSRWPVGTVRELDLRVTERDAAGDGPSDRLRHGSLRPPRAEPGGGGLPADLRRTG